MENKDHHRSGAQTATNLARAARAIYNIIRAALAAGLKGAAVAAVKETLPFLVKLVIGILIAVLLIPMLIFTALPNIFFGYSASDTTAVIDMTSQALSIGGAYMSLEDFENTQVDSVITSLITEYEQQGVKIDRVEVDNSMREEDLLWLIAINSAAHQQDLNTMSADQVLDFCSSKLSTSVSLLSGTETTLKITVERLDPEQIMEELGFDEDAETWAGLSMKHCLKATRSMNTQTISSPISRTTAGTAPGPGTSSTAQAMETRSTYPALSALTPKTIWIWPPMPSRHGKITGATFGAPMGTC